MITLEGITKTYRIGKVEVHALQGIDLEVGEGDFIAIMGASGSGGVARLKSTRCMRAGRWAVRKRRPS